MFKLLLLGGVFYFLYKYILRDDSIPQNPKNTPFIPKSKSSNEEVIEDIDYIEKNNE
ncbi:MAG: hypothetical protein ABI844_06260 [Saprospiraceae bacterium]